MKKSVAAVVGIAIVAGAWLGGTWYTGKKLETETAARIAVANEQLAKIDPQIDLVLSQVSYDRGFFNSQARYALTGGEKGDAEPEFHIEFDARYEHGPFPAAALAQGRFLPTLAVVHSELAKTDDSAAWFEAAQGQTPLAGDTVLSYSGDARFNLRFAALEHEEDGKAIAFSGADLKGDFEAKTKRSVGTFVAPSLSFSTGTEDEEPIALTLTDSEMDFDMHDTVFGIQSGDAELRIGRLAVRSEQDDDANVVIDKLVYGARSTEDEKFIRGEIYLNTGALSINDLPFGSQSLTLKLDKLDGHALKVVSDVYDRMMTPAEGEPSDPTAELLDAAKTLLDANPTMALDNFNWTTDKGSSTVTMHAQWATPAELRTPSPLLLAEALKSVRMDVNVNRPMATDLTAKLLQAQQGLSAEQAQAMAQVQFEDAVASLGELGLLKEDGDTLKSLVEYDGSQILVNGAALPPEVVLGLMMAM